ncbi:MAG: glycosyltransferase family 39 protein [bacterium]
MTRNILIGVSLFFLLIGQFFMFAKADFISGGIFTILAIVLGIIIYLNLYMKIFLTGKIIVNEIKYKLDDLKALTSLMNNVNNSGSNSRKSSKNKNSNSKNSKQSFSLSSLVSMPMGKISLHVIIPKWLLFIVDFVIFGAGQLSLKQGNWNITILELSIAVALFIYLLIMKQKALSFDIVFNKMIQLLLTSGGLILMIFGWILLMNNGVFQQYWGVFYTSIGVFLAFLGLPQADLTEEIVKTEEQKSDILLQKPAWLNNYFVKAVFITVAVVLVLFGNNYIVVPEESMTGIYLYAVAIFFVFLAMPLFNFPEEYKENKVLDIIRLIAAGIAMFIAYLAQTNFATNNIQIAVIYYVIAAVIFIAFFPIYKKFETKDPADPFPIKVEIICFLIILAVAIFFRTYELGSVPFGIENDEAGGYVSHANGPLRSVGWFGIYFHIIQFLQVFISDHRIALKGMGVTVGIISIPALYFLLRFLFNVRTAIFGTMVFSVLRWNVHYGRFGQGAIFTPITEILVLYFLFVALEKRNKFIWFITGVAVGLAWHGVMTTWLIVIPITLYLLLKSLDIKGFFNKHFIGILAFVLGFWLFGSMIVRNLVIIDKVFLPRIYTVSVFGKDPNAPNKNVGAGIVQNTDLVLKMFNYKGDNRQRNSGGEPYEPTMDFVTGMFYAVGFLYALYYSKYYSFFVLVLIFFSQAAGSIFSIEAPSAMRALGTMIPAMIFIALIFDKIWQALCRVFGKKWEFVFLPLLLLIILFPIVKENYRQYFQRWVGGLDELQSSAGMYAKELGMNTRVILYTSIFYPGHPPYAIFRGEEKSNSTPNMTEAMSYFAKTDYEDNCSFFYNFDLAENIDNFKNVYFPECSIVDVDHKHFNKHGSDWKFFKAITVSKEQMEKIRGLDAKYNFIETKSTQSFKNEAPSYKASLDKMIPYSVTWDGGFMTPYYGDFRIINSGNASFEVWINGTKLEKEKYYSLPLGLHHIVIKTLRNSISEKLDLKLETRKRSGQQINLSESLPLQLNMFYNLPRIGLYGKYFAGDAWDMGEPPMYEYIDPFLWITGIPRDYVASQIWSGNIRIPEDGNYRFLTQSNGYVRTVLDGKYYSLENPSDPKAANANKYFYNKPMQKVDNFNLNKGMHRITIYSIYSVVMKLSWQKVGGNIVPVPMENITPEYPVTARR